MKRTMIVALAVLALATVAQAAPALYAEITTPTATSWQLWGTLQENTTGLSGFAINVVGVTTLTPRAPTAALKDDEGTTYGAIGFAAGTATSPVPGTMQAFRYQDTAAPASLIYGVGATAGTITSWPGAASLDPATLSYAVPVLLASGKRNAGEAVTIDYARSGANVFTAIGATTTLEVPVVPEPATLALLAMGGLAALRRRR